MSHSFNVSSYFSCVSMGIHSKGNRTWPAAHSPTDEPVPRHSQLTYNMFITDPQFMSSPQCAIY